MQADELIFYPSQFKYAHVKRKKYDIENSCKHGDVKIVFFQQKDIRSSPTELFIASN
jgi:hypothetical protein